MEHKLIAVLGSLVIALAACNIESPTRVAPTVDESTGLRPQYSVTVCDTIDPDPGAAVATDVDAIVTNCGEVCDGIGLGTGHSISAVVGEDTAYIRCADATVHPVPSSHSCWDCAVGCAGSSCQGAFCLAVPGQNGSDCITYTCRQGYTAYEIPGLGKKCIKCEELADLSVQIVGQDSIPPGEECTWEANATGGNGSYTYSWYNQGIWQGTGQWYTGGLFSGSTGSTFTIKVVVSSGGASTFDELVVREMENADLCAL